MKAKQTGRTERQGVHLAARAFERLGFAFREQSESDFGIDAHLELVCGESATGRLLGVQVKAGPSFLKEDKGDHYVFRTGAEHIEYWVGHALPVVVCLCDLDSELVYWQIVNRETAESTGRRFKISVPKKQVVGTGSIAQLVDLMTPLVPQTEYTVVRTKDTSHGSAKRYSVDVVLNGTKTKAEIASVIRQVTAETIASRYYRDEVTRSRWGDIDAHVVGLYIYLSVGDQPTRNWICQSQWISDDLAKKARPIQMVGENVGKGIIVEWNKMHAVIAEMKMKSAVGKDGYFARIEPIIQRIEELVAQVAGELTKLANGIVDEEFFLSSVAEELAAMEGLERTVNDIETPPFECEEVDHRLQLVACRVGNVALYFSERGQSTWKQAQRISLAVQTLQEAVVGMQELDYEIRKVR